MNSLETCISRVVIGALLALAPSLSLAADKPLAGTDWRVTTIDGTKSAEGVTSTLVFNADKSVNGNGGCNNFRGDVAIDGASMKFGLLASTMMACEEAKSKQEWAFHQALAKTATFKLENDELSLLDKDGKVVVVLAAL